MLPQRVYVFPNFVNDKEIRIKSVPMDMELERAWLGPGSRHISDHPHFKGISLSRFCPVLGNDTVWTSFFRCWIG